MRAPAFFFVLLSSCVGVVACGGTSSGDGDGTSGKDQNGTSPAPAASQTPATCAEATAALCAKACACGSGSCVITYGTVATEEHDSLSDCQNYYAFLVCGDDAKAKGYEEPTCRAALGQTSCTPGKSAASFPSTACPNATH